MSENRSDSSKRKRSDSVQSERARVAQLTDTAIPILGSSDDIFDVAPEPTDDSPTIVSKNTPKPAPLPDDGLRGRHLAHFELLEQIGAGGMAAVLRARDTQLDRIVALKILPPDMATDAENVQRFHQEARSAAKLDHENIARVFFCGEDQRLHFIAFEFVEGENLRTILDRRSRLPVAEALPYILQIAAGLAHAAERGVVHRDIKPSNIIITPAGRAKLVDMGLARSLGPQKDVGLTHSGVTLGTFDYISPEQAIEPRDADVRSDIYSLGCTWYHMITGRAPVPEGTAAKKLHHHQYIAPTDPRELVRGLPDEIALILDRMMDKNPRNRYQTAGELVQHLLTAAKHLKVGADVPEGVLFVEAPLPRTGGGRPYLLVGLAVAVVVSLLWFLDQPTATPTTAPPPRDHVADIKGEEKKKDGTEKKIPSNDDKKPDVRPDPADFKGITYDERRMTPEELVSWMTTNRNAPHIELTLASNLFLDESMRELVIEADKVTVKRATEFVGRPTITLTYKGGAARDRAALRLRAKKTEVHDVQFVVDGNTTDAPLIGLALEGEKHEVRGCNFVQKRPSLRLTSLLVLAGKTGTAAPQVDLIENTFLGFKSDKPKKSSDVCGQDAITCRGAVEINAQNCAFGPHQATFRLEGKETLKLDHCSVMAADQSAVFQFVSSEASANLTVNHSLFSRPDVFGTVPEMEPLDAVFIRLASEQNRFEYKGTDNRFHKLTALLRLPSEMASIVELKDFQQQKNVGEEQRSTTLTVTPWENPRAILNPGDDLPLRIFAPNRYLTELRQTDSPTTNLIGVEKLAGMKFNEDLLAKKPALIFNPSAQSDSAKGVFNTLDSAVGAAKDGDTILIQHDDEVVLDKLIPVESLLRNEVLTIRAAQGMHPILTLGKPRVKEAALFRLLDGHLQFEDLEIRLRPEPGKLAYTSQTVVALMGEGHCSFKNCVVTLDQNNQNDTKLALATLPDASNVMKMDMKTEPVTPRLEMQKPKLWFTNCFVRGTGDLVWNPTGRPFDLEANRLLVAVSGSFCNVDVIGTAMTTGVPSVLKLERTTTYLGGQLLHVQGKDVMDAAKLPQYQVSAQECVFMNRENRQALIHFETKDSTDDLDMKLKDRFVWEAGRTNGFGDFEPFLKHVQAGEKTSPDTVFEQTTEEWKKWNKQSQFRLTLADPSARDTKFEKLLPSQLRLRDSLDLGADPAGSPKLPTPR